MNHNGVFFIKCIAIPKTKPAAIPPTTSRNMIKTTVPIDLPPPTPDEANAMVEAIEKKRIFPTSLNVDDANIAIGIPLTLEIPDNRKDQ